MKHHTPSIAQEIEHLSDAELEDLYNIEINDNGTIFDITENLKFQCLADWITFMDSDSSYSDNYVSPGKRYATDWDDN